MKRNIAKLRAAWHSGAANYDNTAHLVTFGADIPWISGGNGEEWLYIDLGAVSGIESVRVHWGGSFAEAYELALSNDGTQWSTSASAEGAAEAVVETAVGKSARYVKILCNNCSGDNYVIRSVEVMGENELEYPLHPMPAAEADGTQLLSGNWRICRASQTSASGEELSEAGFDADEWLPATVPGTALVSYLNAGAIPDPDYDDWQFQISEEWFTADFWYRCKFEIPADKQGRRVYLDFDAINWKADVFFNGKRLANEIAERERSIEGAFIRGRFDVTELAHCGGENALAVYICKNDTPGRVTTQGLAFGPGPNGGLLGADNPTLHASVGWDWLPTIRGRNIGIYGDVRLSYGGAAEIVDPWIESNLRLLAENEAIPCEDMMLREGVLVDGKSEPLSDWRGGENEGFTVDFGQPVGLGSVTFIWGSEAGGAAADIESRHPELFRLEISDDGESWRNFNAYPGGEVEIMFFGLQKAEAHAGSESFEGHAVADSVQGSTAFVPLDLSMFGSGMVDMPVFAEQQARYMRFTVLKRRELNGRPVDTRIETIKVYAESPQQVEQATEHHYELDTKQAELILRSELRNRSAEPVTARLSGRILPDGPEFETTVELSGGETLPVEMPILLDAPKLWWPNTYGEQFLYTAELALEIGGEVSHKKSFRFGVRRFDYPIDGGIMTLYCNGVRIVAKGGNWGMDDGLKRDNARTLDDKVRLHAEANLTMIRNWVGMTNHQGFYDACDKYGILIWDDFWLANPVDGPEPTDPAMFLENAADKIRRVRSHAALALYCGRNEGNPNDVINAGLDELTRSLDGSRVYIPNSASQPVGSGGGYSLAMPGGNKGNKQYFDDVSSAVLRSERGIPNVPALESLKRFLKPENLWPINEVWALHDWTYHMNGPANTYMYALQTYLGGDFEIPVDRVQGQEPQESDPVYREYKAAVAKMCEEAGKCWTIEDFSRAAQLINYDNHRGLFEALASRRSNGLLMWMSQSSWPSFMWQTYDHYLDTNGGYFGTKAGNQPTRAIFDPRDNGILLANATPDAFANVKTTVELFNLDGSMVYSREYTSEILAADAFGIKIAVADFGAAESDIVFMRLKLEDEKGKLLGCNTYWHNRAEYQNYRALNDMPAAEVALEAVSKAVNESGNVVCTLRLKNGAVPALGVRVRLLGEDDAAVLPVFYSDNYLTMMPNEERIITAEYAPDRIKGEEHWLVGGWNVK